MDKKFLKGLTVGILGISIFAATIAGVISTATNANDGDVITAAAWNDLISQISSGGSGGSGVQCTSEGQFGCNVALTGSSSETDLWSCKYGWDGSSNSCLAVPPGAIEWRIKATGDAYTPTNLYGMLSFEIEFYKSNDLSGEKVIITDATGVNESPTYPLSLMYDGVIGGHAFAQGDGTYGYFAFVFDETFNVGSFRTYVPTYYANQGEHFPRSFDLEYKDGSGNWIVYDSLSFESRYDGVTPNNSPYRLEFKNIGQ